MRVVHWGLKGTVNSRNTNKLTQSLTIASTQKFKKRVFDDGEFFDVRQRPHLGNSRLVITVVEAKVNRSQLHNGFH